MKTNNVNILNNMIVEEKDGNYLVKTRYGDVGESYSYSPQSNHTAFYNYLVLEKEGDIPEDFDEYARVYVYDDLLLENLEWLDRETIVPIIKASNPDNYERILEVKDRYNEVHLIIDKPMSWNLVEYISTNKITYLRVITTEVYLRHMNFADGNDLVELYTFPPRIMEKLNFEIEIQSSTIINNDKKGIEEVLQKYLKEEKEEDTGIIESKWSKVLRGSRTLTPNIISTNRDSVILNFNTQERLDIDKPLMLFTVTNDPLEYKLKSLLILNSFREYKRYYKETVKWIKRKR